MNKLKLMLGLLVLISGNCYAEANLDDKAPLIPLTQSSEVEHILLSSDDSKTISVALFRLCTSCPLQKKNLTPLTVIFKGNKPLSHIEALQYSGKSGIIETEIDSERLVRIRFF